MKRLVLVGAGGFAGETRDGVKAINAVKQRWDFLGFLDDVKVDDPLITQRGARILGSSALLEERDCEDVMAFTDLAVRKGIDACRSTLGGVWQS